MSMTKLEKLHAELCPNGVEYKELAEIFNTRNGYTPSKSNSDYWINGNIPWFRMEDIRENGNILYDSIQKVTESAVKGKLFPAYSIIIATSATIGEHALITVESLANQRFTYLMLKDEYKTKYDIKFLYYYCYKLDEWCLSHLNQGSFPSVDMSQFPHFKIPVPPLEVQAEIVRILDNFTDLTAELTAELTARKKQYEYYRDELLSFSDSECEWRTIKEVCSISAGGDVPKESFSKNKTDIFNIPIISNGIGDNALYGYTSIEKIAEPAVTVAARGTIGYAEYRDYPYYPIIRLLTVIPKEKSYLNTKYLYYVLQRQHYDVPKTGIPQLTSPMIQIISIPIPSIEEQARIVSILDRFDKLCNDISDGLPAEIEARRKQYEYYRDKLLSFEEVRT